MAKRLESISVRSAENGTIVNIHTVDEDSDGDKVWDSEEQVFLDNQKSEMVEFITDKVTELT